MYPDPVYRPPPKLTEIPTPEVPRKVIWILRKIHLFKRV